MSSTSFSASLKEVNEILRLHDGSTPNGTFQYNGQWIYANKSSPKSTLDSIKSWNKSDFLHFYTYGDNYLNDSDMTKVCQALMGHLTSKKPPLLALTLYNHTATCTKSYLDILETSVMGNLPEGTRTILRISSPSNDVMGDWVVHLNNNPSVAIDYFWLSNVDNYTLKDGFLESFSSSCCTVKVFDIEGFKTNPEQFDKVLEFFSYYQTSVLRLRCDGVPGTQREIRDKLAKTVSVAARNGLLMAGIEWWYGDKWNLFEGSPADKSIGGENSTEKKFVKAKAPLKTSNQNLNKLVFVGESAAGKSSVLRSLEGKSFEKLVSSKNDDQPIESMHLVALTADNKLPWTVMKESTSLLESMKNGKEQFLNVVDINGAKHFSMLLKLAITNKTVIVYCVKMDNLVNNDSEEMDMICNAIIMFERLAPASIVVIVATYAAELPEDTLKQLNLTMKKAMFAKGIRRLFPNILGKLYFHPLENSTANSDPKMVEFLRHTIFTIITGQAGFNQEVPDFYPRFIGHLKDSWIKVASMVHLPKVDALGKQAGLSPKDVVGALAWAHDAGLIQYYGTVEGKLKETIVINPQMMYQMFQSYLYDGINLSRAYATLFEVGQDVDGYEMGGVLSQNLLIMFWSRMSDDESKFMYDISFHFRMIIKADDPLMNAQLKVSNDQQLLAVPAMMPNWKGFSDWIKYEKSIHDGKHKSSGALAGEEIPMAEAIP